MPLGSAESAALEGALRSKRGRHALHEHVVVALLAFFKSKNLSLRELESLTPPANQSEHADWLEEWRDYARDSGLSDSSDVNNVARFVGTDPSVTGVGQRSGKAFAVANALSQKGVTLDAAAELAIAAALVDAEQGEMVDQCRSVECVWIVYTGQSPGEEVRTWLMEHRSAAGKRVGAEGVRIDPRTCSTYVKLLKGTSVMVLERALRNRSGLLWTKYYQVVMEQLTIAGLTLAATRLMKLEHFAEQQNSGQPDRKMRYLWSYFFDVQMGLGLPVEICYKSALMLGSSPAAMEAQAFDMRPTVAAEIGAEALPTLFAGTSLGFGSPPPPPDRAWSHQQQPPPPPYPPPPYQSIQYGAPPPPPQPDDEKDKDKKCALCFSTRHKTEQCHAFQAAKKAVRKVKEAGGGSDESAAAAAAAAAAAVKAP